jgi:hypothetical protein
MSKKQIESSEWQERLQTFTSGNKNRTAAIAAEGMTVVENTPLVSVDFDPPGKGNAPYDYPRRLHPHRKCPC